MKNKKKKSVNIVVINTKIFLNMKKKRLVEYRKDFLKNVEKHFAIIRSYETFLLVFLATQSFLYHL